MFKHKSTKESIKKLESFGNILIPPAYGELASGLEGEGRLPEAVQIVTFIEKYYKSELPLLGKKVLISAGPTVEELDPVRYISNHSSGKMGFSLAKTASDMGADVILVSGPTNQTISSDNVTIFNVKTGEEMYNAIMQEFHDSDIVIMSAAVSDYKPKQFSKKKIKKHNKEIFIKLEKNIDILNELGKIKSKQVLVGFSLENNLEVENAKQKLVKKNLDLIVLNSLNDEGAGFGFDTNKISVINRPEKITTYGLKPKTEVAKDIFQHVIELI